MDECKPLALGCGCLCALPDDAAAEKPAMVGRCRLAL